MRGFHSRKLREPKRGVQDILQRERRILEEYSGVGGKLYICVLARDPKEARGWPVG